MGDRQRWRGWWIGPVVSAGVCSFAFAVATDTGPEDALKDMPSFGWAVVRMLLVLGGIIAALLVIAKLVLPRLGGRPAIGRGRLIEIVDASRLEPHKHVYLIRVAKQFFLVGTSEGNIRTLAGGSLDQKSIEEALADHAPAGKASPSERRSKRRFMDLLKRGS